MWHQVNGYKHNFNNSPTGFNKWKTDVNYGEEEVGGGEMVEVEPWMPHWEVHLSIMSQLHKRNTHHYTVFFSNM